MRTADPDRFLRISNIMVAIHESQVDIRKLEYFRNQIFGAPGSIAAPIKSISVDDFKMLMQSSLSLPQSKTYIVDEMLLAIQEFENDPSLQNKGGMLTKAMIDDFFNLMHYWPPVTVKRDKNLSSQMYRVVTGAQAGDHHTARVLGDRVRA
jgi:hypothetical protein